MKKKEILTTILLSKELAGTNQKAIEIVTDYSRVADIVYRTYLAMGKKTSFKVSTSSTVTEKLNTNVFAATH